MSEPGDSQSMCDAPSEKTNTGECGGAGNQTGSVPHRTTLKKTIKHKKSRRGASPDHMGANTSLESTKVFQHRPSTSSSCAITNSINSFLREQMTNCGNMDAVRCYESASMVPPITTDSLAELDMPRIINNPKLRHDVNFDRELHFRPNLDGSRGKQKLRAADEYWLAVECELCVLHYVQEKAGQHDEHLVNVVKTSRKRLPKIFKTVRDILKSLVPDNDQPKITERLDVDLLMQEIDRGVCDLVDLAAWLAKVLKKHCAPMRDSLVDKMQKTITKGAQDSNRKQMVSGLRQLLNILEAMKLDVANHQIRHMRPLLVGDTINFQKRYNEHRMALGKIKTEGARTWLLDQQDHLGPGIPGLEPTFTDALASGMLKELLFIENIPATFYLDMDRLRVLQHDMHSLVYHQVCVDVLVEMLDKKVPKSELPHALQELRSKVAAIVGPVGLFSENVENIAAEIVRIVLTLEGKSVPYDFSLTTFAEQTLHADLGPNSKAYRDHAEKLSNKLEHRLRVSVTTHSRMGALALQEALVSPVPVQPTQPVGYGAVCVPTDPSSTSAPSDSESDLIRRLTHILVLHWQVWAELVYLAPPVLDPPEDLNPTPGPSPSSSPSPINHRGFRPVHESALKMSNSHNPLQASSSPPDTAEAEMKETTGEQGDTGEQPSSLPGS